MCASFGASFGASLGMMKSFPRRRRGEELRCIFDSFIITLNAKIRFSKVVEGRWQH